MDDTDQRGWCRLLDTVDTSTPSGKSRLVDIMFPLVIRVTNPGMRKFLVREVMDRLGLADLTEGEIEEALAAYRRGQGPLKHPGSSYEPLF